jgi:hypothetical protein
VCYVGCDRNERLYGASLTVPCVSLSHLSFMETNKTGERIGDFFGTVAWLWVFHRFRMDGMVLLGFEHPWEHGHADHGDDGGHGSIIPGSPQAKVKEATANWEKFSERATIPGDDDDDDDEDDDDDDE